MCFRAAAGVGRDFRGVGSRMSGARMPQSGGFIGGARRGRLRRTKLHYMFVTGRHDDSSKEFCDPGKWARYGAEESVDEAALKAGSAPRQPRPFLRFPPYIVPICAEIRVSTLVLRIG